MIRKYPTLTDKQTKRLAWWREGRFGMFVHYGVYTATRQDCWHMFNARQSPEAYYREYESKLTAEHFDARDLVALAQQAGCAYMVFPSRHHEGYCLWDTDTTDLNSVRGTPKRDFVAEVTEAAREAGMKIGLYYSLLDWRYQAYWDGPTKNPDAWRRFTDTVHAQVEELVTRYGKLDILWYDGCWPHEWEISAEEDISEAWRSAELNAMVRAHQPHILINNRSSLPEDFGTPEKQLVAEGRPWELCNTLAYYWGHSPYDTDQKSPQGLVSDLATCVCQGGNMLINVGPQPDGTIDPWQRRVLERVGAWLKTYGECIYGCGECTQSVLGPWVMTRKGEDAYVVLCRYPGDSLTIGKHNLPFAIPEEAELLGQGTRIRVRESERNYTFQGLPATPPDPIGTVIRFKTKPLTSEKSTYSIGQTDPDV